MTFKCPACDVQKLEISFSLELPPQGDEDEITLQTFKCAACGFHGVAVYRESRHGSLSSESWSHDGYLIENEPLERLYEALLICPSPRDKHCPCPTHAFIRSTKLGQSSTSWDRYGTQVWHESGAVAGSG